MNDKSILMEMYEQFLEEREEVQKLLNSNLSRVSEIEECLKAIFDKEDSDFHVFSPRSVENVYREEIDHLKTEKRELEVENRSHYRKINKLDHYLDGMKKMMDEGTFEEENSEERIEIPDVEDMDRNLKVLNIQEKERQRIARDLHDTSLQNLAHLVHKIELSSMFIDQDPLRAKLELAAINKNLKTIIDEIRNTIFNLRPMSFDDLGLKDSLEQLIIRLKQTNPDIDITMEMEDNINCHNDLILMSIFRVVHECCANAIEHSNGNRISVVIKNEDEKCVIHINDNGDGFDVREVMETKQKHFGLMIVKERVELLGGRVQVKSSAGDGTDILIMIPLKNIERI